MDVPKYLTVAEAAQIARVDPRTIRRWYREGKLTRYRIEGRVLIDEAELNWKIAPVPPVTEA
jgi:excisionase family DNA binding protein